MKSAIYWCFALASVCPALSAATGAGQSRELADIQAKIRKVGADVEQLAEEKSAQLEQLKKLEKQFGEQINALNGIKREITQQQQALQEIRNKVSAAQKDIQTQQRGLEGLIKSAYAIGDQQGLKLTLNQHDPALSGRMLVYHNYLSKARLQKLQALAEDAQALRQMEAQKDTESQLLQVALDKKQRETEALDVLKNQREILLAQLNSDYASKHDQLAKLLQDEKKLGALVASLQKTDDNAGTEPAPVVEATPSKIVQPPAPVAKIPKKEPPVQASVKAFAELQGQLPWPVQGTVAERFGSRRFETTWDGAVINAREGADIHAVAAGRVVYADWLRGYGLMIIVDHGKGYMTLYAFNQSLRKSVGEHVRAGETLASVGRSGGRSQAALYFGIRKQGRPVDPMKWCRSPAKG